MKRFSCFVGALIASLSLVTPALARSPAFGFCEWQKDPSSCFVPFSEDLAAVPTGRPDDRPVYGFIDPDGTMAITPAYEEAKSFANGLAAVATEKGWGYIDKQGDWAIEPRFNVAHHFNAAGAAIVETGGRLMLIDRSGDVVRTFARGARYIARDNDARLDVTPVETPVSPEVWNAKTGDALDLPDDVADVQAEKMVESGVLVSLRGDGRKWRRGFLGAKGQWLAQPGTFTARGQMETDGKTFVVDDDEGTHLVDRQGEALSDAHYRRITLVAPGTWLATADGGQASVLDDTGQMVRQLGERPRRLNRDARPAIFLADKAVFVVRAGGKLRRIDVPDVADAREQDGRIWLRDGDHAILQVLDSDGMPMLGAGMTEELRAYDVDPVSRSDEARPQEGLHLPLATLRPEDYNDPPAILSRDGRVVSKDDWSSIQTSYESQAPLVVQAGDDLYGAIDGEGAWVVEPEYEELASFQDGYALAIPADGDKGVIVDAQGTRHGVRRHIFRTREKLSGGVLTYSERMDGKQRVGLWDVAGETTIGASRFAEIGDFVDRHAPARRSADTRDEEKWGVINTRGEWVIDPRADGYNVPERIAPGLFLLERRESDFESLSRVYDIASIRTGGIIAKDLRTKPKPAGEGRFVIEPATGGVRLIDVDGAVLARSDGDTRRVEVEGNWVVVTHGDGYGAVNAKGAWQVPPVFQERLDFVLPERTATVSNGQRTVVVDDHGTKLPIGDPRSEAIPGMARYARTENRDNRTALLTPEGSVVTRLKGKYALETEIAASGLVGYQDDDNNLYGFMNADGKRTIGPFFDRLGPMTEGRAFFQRNRISGPLYGFISRAGAIAAPAAYDRATSFSDHRALVSKPDGTFGYIDRDGTMAIGVGMRCGHIVMTNSEGQTWPSSIQQNCSSRDTADDNDAETETGTTEGDK